MLNTQKISSNVFKSQLSQNTKTYLNNFNNYIQNDELWYIPEYNNNMKEELNENILQTNYGESCKHLYSNLFNINNIMGNYNDNTIHPYAPTSFQEENYEKKNIQANYSLSKYVNINGFDYMRSMKKIIFLSDEHICGEFTIYQFIKYLILEIDKYNLFLKNELSNNLNVIHLIENNICIVTKNSTSNIFIRLSTSKIMENIDFLFAFNNILYEYKMNDFLNDLENIEDNLQNKIIVIFDQFLYLLINHTLKIILAYTIQYKQNDQYEKISSLLIYRLSKLVHNQLMTHIQMNINITKYLNMTKQIYDDLLQKITNEMKKKKKYVNIYPDSSIKIESSGDNIDSNPTSIDSDANLNIVKSSVNNDEILDSISSISEINKDINKKNKLEEIRNQDLMGENKKNEKIFQQIGYGESDSLSLKDKINMDLNKILSEMH